MKAGGLTLPNTASHRGFHSPPFYLEKNLKQFKYKASPINDYKRLKWQMKHCDWWQLFLTNYCKPYVNPDEVL